MGTRDVERRVADSDRTLAGPVSRTLAREVEELDAVFAFAAECALAARKAFAQPEPFHSRVGHGWRIAGEQCAALDRGYGLGGVRSELPVGRVGGLEQADVL